MSTSKIEGGTPRRGPPAGLGSLGRSVLINGLGPYLVYRFAAPHFPDRSTAPLLLAAAIPAADLCVVVARRHTIDVIAVIALVQLSVSVAISAASGSVTDAFIGHALQPAALGLVFAASALVGRPLIRPLARQSVAGDDPERQARFDARAALPAARRVFLWMTVIWAVVLGAESAMLLVAVRELPAADYIWVSSLTHYVVIGVLVAGSIRYGRRREAAAAARAASG